MSMQINYAKGSDTSFWQTRRDITPNIYPDWEKMARTGIKFSIHRAGQGLWKDTSFAHDFKAAQGAGIPRGSYWFYDSRYEPNRQADLWLKTLNGDLGELPLWCDFEDDYKGKFHGWRHWYNFIVRLQEKAPGKEIGIYTGFYYWKENTLGVGISIASLAFFKQFPLWIANYGVTSPLVPLPWDTWTLWQFTDNGDGTIYGVESLNIDLNYFNGDEEAFRERFKIGQVLPAPTGYPSIEAVTIKTSDNQLIHLKKQE